MKNSIDLLQRVYDATHSGLDIITDLVTGIDDEVINHKKAFRLRPEERTPSAHLYPPKDSGDCWHVKDYGMSEEGGFFSPVDLYMWSKGYAQSQFSLVLHELLEEYGVAEELKSSVNRPEITRHPAETSEQEQPPRVVCREGFTQMELAAWGPRVKAEHLTELGWKAVDSVSITKGGEVVVKKPTPTYPIFAQKCQYQDKQGNICSFLKLYEPKNANKAFRFSIVGNKPPHYIFGLSALRRKYEENGEQKLDEVVLVSGGSDAVNLLSMGYQPIWLGSETEELREEDFSLLQKYTKRVINVPDVDATGRSMGQRLALRIPELYTAWLSPEDMNRLHDNRGRQRKDLKDFIQLHPDRKSVKMLMDRAKCAKFWHETADEKSGVVKYELSRTSFDYFLELNGFFTLKDDNSKEPEYIRVEGIKVTHVQAKTISNFIVRWADEHGLPTGLQNKLRRCHDLPTTQKSTLRERDDLYFTKATATSQLFHFDNCWVEVTKDGIVTHPYVAQTDHYVWEESIVHHTYRAMEPMFTVENTEFGYLVRIAEHQPSKFFLFLINASSLYWRKVDEEGQTLTDAEVIEENQCLLSKMACIGYLLHRYKSESTAWAPFLQDAALGNGEDECNGRSGKSFFYKAIGKMLNVYPIEARVPSVVDNRFLFDGVNSDTDLIVVDECHKKLDFDIFFSKITDGFRAEEKGNHPFFIPFSQSPKLCFASNYVYRKHDPSTMGRIWQQIFADYYHVATKQNDYRETRSIRDDFGCDLMGTEYPESDWQADIAFMLQCLQFYLSLPVAERKIMPPLSKIERREQQAAVGKDFRQWADENIGEDSEWLDHEIKAQDMLNDFNRETGNKWSMTLLTRKLKAYCEFAEHICCLNPTSVTGKKTDGEPWVKRDNGNQVRYYYIQSVKASLSPDVPDEPIEEQLDLEF